MSPDLDAVIDKHPRYPNIVFASGFSGMFTLGNFVVFQILIHIISLQSIYWIPSTYVLLYLRTGHGFKLSPVIGKIITELVMDDTPSYDLTPFRLGRFQTAQESS